MTRPIRSSSPPTLTDRNGSVTLPPAFAHFRSRELHGEAAAAAAPEGEDGESVITSVGLRATV